MIDIYLITNKINGKQYVGKTQQGYMKRFVQHCNAYNHGARNYISCAIHKWGSNNFDIKLLAQVEDDSWEFWESYYIQQYKTLYSEGGYNITTGGDCNPMNFEIVQQKHLEKCRSEYFRNLQSELSKGKTHSEETKELCRQNTLKNLDVCLKGFRSYNNSKKIKVGIVNEEGYILKKFESLSEACQYCNISSKEAGKIKRFADKFNKNGKRARFCGYYWTII